MLGRDRKLRAPVSLVAFSLLALATLGPLGSLGCDPPMPQMPQFPKAEAPAVEPPKVEPPQAPTVPQTPTMPQGGGNCCIRGGALAKEKCQGGERCCIKDFDDSDACESHRGFWFFNKDGCAGAC